VLPGATVSFVVGATGTGNIQYQWLFNGGEIPNATNATYTIASANLGSEGEYMARVTDAIGSINSQAARLIVKVAPIILIPPIGQTNAVGSTAVYTVRCSGSVPMTFIWRRGSVPIATNVLFTT